MAEGSTSLQTESGSSHPDVDGTGFLCSRCAEEGRADSAEVQCTSCVKNYCQSCSQAHSTLMPDHPLLGMDLLHRWAEVEQTDIAKKSCDVDATAPRIRKFKVRSKKDVKECNISDICQLANGQYVAVDYSNKNIKLYGENFKVLARHEFKSWPRCVAPIANTEVAVTIGELDKPGEVHFVSTTGGHLKLSKKIKMEHFCSGIAHFDKHTYVGSRDSIFKYVLKDQLIGKIYEDSPSGAYSFSVNKFKLVEDGTKLYVSDWKHNRMVILDNQGQQLSTLVLDEDLVYGASGIAVGMDGRVFMSGIASKNVVQVFPETGGELTTLAGEADGVVGPNAVWIDERLNKLVVAQTGDTVLLVQL
ncbi:uncharacterized protein LOC128213375 [Mya arenaria]|uniref:uncharacterized protein LOC128213375 n=1 Tax=Mya arenaria TaxID=6604 RepID=UPI0022E5F20F|nr:uncharacterized protein LOC128213375 [Mya arenaria]